MRGLEVVLAAHALAEVVVVFVTLAADPIWECAVICLMTLTAVSIIRITVMAQGWMMETAESMMVAWSEWTITLMLLCRREIGEKG
jgi:hypothetical protein